MLLRRFLRRLFRDRAALRGALRRPRAFCYPHLEQLEDWNLPNMIGPAPSPVDLRLPADWQPLSRPVAEVLPTDRLSVLHPSVDFAVGAPSPRISSGTAAVETPVTVLRSGAGESASPFDPTPAGSGTGGRFSFDLYRGALAFNLEPIAPAPPGCPRRSRPKSPPSPCPRPRCLRPTNPRAAGRATTTITC